MSTPPTDWSVWQDPDVAANFRRRRMAIPGAAAQGDVTLKLIGAVGAVSRVLDLGCGDGFLLETILAAHPRAAGVGVDGSADMLSAARARFGQIKVTPPMFVHADFNDPAWRDRLPPGGPFDAIVSGFAIHHSEDGRKRSLYAEIHDLLRPGGVFVNVEHVASASPLGEALFDRTYAEHLRRLRADQGEAVTVEQVIEELRARADREANRLSPVEAQLSWLRKIGFVDVDCYWKWLELAVIAGFRQPP